MRYYAIQWVYGRATNTETARRIGTYYAFASKADRDAWVAERTTDYSGNAGYREPIGSGDPELRTLLRKDAEPYAVPQVIDYGTYVADLAAMAQAHREWLEGTA